MKIIQKEKGSKGFCMIDAFEGDIIKIRMHRKSNLDESSTWRIVVTDDMAKGDETPDPFLLETTGYEED